MKLFALQLGKHIAREQLQKVMHIFCCSKACARNRGTLVNITKANARRLVNIDDVGVLAPTILIVHSSIGVLIDQTRPILL